VPQGLTLETFNAYLRTTHTKPSLTNRNVRSGRGKKASKEKNSVFANIRTNVSDMLLLSTKTPKATVQRHCGKMSPVKPSFSSHSVASMKS
jgi:hypothetical protein